MFVLCLLFVLLDIYIYCIFFGSVGIVVFVFHVCALFIVCFTGYIYLLHLFWLILKTNTQKAKIDLSMTNNQAPTSPFSTSPSKPFVQNSPSLYADTSLQPGEISEGFSSSSVTMFPFGSSSTFGLRPITSAPPIEAESRDVEQSTFYREAPFSSSTCMQYTL